MAIKFYHPMQLERVIIYLINNDRDVMVTFSSWEMERDDIANILIEHFRSMGMYMILNSEHGELIRKNIIFQLKHSTEFKIKLAEIRREIEKTRAKYRREGEVIK